MIWVFVATASFGGILFLSFYLAGGKLRKEWMVPLVWFMGVIGITSTLAMVVMTILTSKNPLVDVPLATVGAGLGWLLGQNDALRRLSNKSSLPTT